MSGNNVQLNLSFVSEPFSGDPAPLAAGVKPFLQEAYFHFPLATEQARIQDFGGLRMNDGINNDGPRRTAELTLCKTVGKNHSEPLSGFLAC